MPKIFVADDEPDNRYIIQRVLELAHHNVLAVASGSEAVLHAPRFAPDLILLDLAMPGMDGFATAAALRQDPALAEVPFIAITAHALPGYRERVLNAGFDGYMTKPFEVNSLMALVAQFVLPTT